MPINKISIGSRYYESYQKLQGFLNSPYLIDPEVPFEGYKNNIDTISISNIIVSRISNFLESELFTKDETLLLLENLLPNIGVGGRNSLIMQKSIERIDYFNNREQYKDIISEYEKSMEAFNEIGNFVREKLKNKYKELLTSSQVENKIENEECKYENPHDDIFKDGWSYQLFLEMYNRYVKGNSEEKARWSYLYWVLDENKSCIYSNQSRFEKFIKKNYIDQFSRIQAPSKYKEFNEIEHVQQLRSIQSKFEAKCPRSNE